MQKQHQLWQFIFDRITQSRPVIFLCVLESHGSSPGRQGFKMAVAEDTMFGSIGGGIMEHKFVEMAREKLHGLSEPLVKRQMHNKSAAKNQSGMICSGEQTIVLFHLNKKHSAVVDRIIHCLNSNRNGLLRLSSNKFDFEEAAPDTPHFRFVLNSEDDWIFEEKLGYKNFLYIIGGGHCALAFSRLMSTMDFYIRLFEERKNLNTMEQNSFVHEKTIISNFSELKSLVPSGYHNFVVIMTFGYRTDDIALRSIIDKDFKYLGILGSQAKKEKMFEEWKRDNLPEDKLKKIFSPIGINIHSQTPEEIAISIAAEIISIKNIELTTKNTKVDTKFTKT